MVPGELKNATESEEINSGTTAADAVDAVLLHKRISHSPDKVIPFHLWN
jgi:hypothetical protein